MDDLLDPIRDVFEGQIDFHGQHLAESLSNLMLIAFSVIAVVSGFVKQDIYLTLWIGLAGTALTMLAVVPPWPFFNQNPQPWLGSKSALLNGGIVVGGRKVQ